jgi:glycosyltransferase involved in cell wall biosynthesis
MDVSVIIPIFNAEDYLSCAVRSALDQPETGQVILIEDGSTDDSARVAHQWAQRSGRVSLLHHPGRANRGISASRNLGLRAARCPFVAFLDADDYYLANRFRAARTAFENDPLADGVYDAVGTDYANSLAEQWYRTLERDDLTTITETVRPEALFEAILAGDKGFFHTSGITVRRNLVDRTGLFETSLALGEDTAMWLKMAAVGRLVSGSLTDPVSMRRVHGENTMRRWADRYRNERVAMAEALLAWGRDALLPARRIRLLEDLLLRFELEAIDRSQPYLTRKARELACLGRFAMHHPQTIRSRYYRHVVGYTTGWRRIRRIVSSWLPRVRRANEADPMRSPT